MSLLHRLNLPPVWLALFIALAWAIAQGSTPIDGGIRWAGWALVVAGLGLMVWSAIAIRRAGTTIMPGARPNALVESGPYRFSRNPIYVADLAILAGAALALGAPLALLLLVPFHQVLLRLFVLPEEAVLERDLGLPYRAYRARVRRWL